MYKGREPNSSDEEEMVANLFDARCWVVMTGENKEKFVSAEGIELMLLVIKVPHPDASTIHCVETLNPKP